MQSLQRLNCRCEQQASFSKLRRNPGVRPLLDPLPVRGWVDHDLVEVRQAKYGKGLFAKVGLERGEVLGEYPGLRRPASVTAEKCKAAPATLQARAAPEKSSVYSAALPQYVFQCDDGSFLDPTDGEGRVADSNRFSLGPLEVDAALARMNESDEVAKNKGGRRAQRMLRDYPTAVIAGSAQMLLLLACAGAGCNADILERIPGILEVVVLRPVPKGGEVLISYGPYYDRSGYPDAAAGEMGGIGERRG